MASVIPTIDPNALGSDTDDSDFAASDPYGSDYDSSSSETFTTNNKGKRPIDQPDEALASGDEGIVEPGKQKRRKKHKKGKGKAKGRAKGDEARKEDDEYDEEEGVGARLKRRREGRGER